MAKLKIDSKYTALLQGYRRENLNSLQSYNCLQNESYVK